MTTLSNEHASNGSRPRRGASMIVRLAILLRAIIRRAFSTAFGFGSAPTMFAVEKRMARLRAVDALPGPKLRTRLFASGATADKRGSCQDLSRTMKMKKAIVNELER